MLTEKDRRQRPARTEIDQNLHHGDAEKIKGKTLTTEATKEHRGNQKQTAEEHEG